MSFIWKWLVVSGLVVLQIMLGQGAMAQTDFNGAISSAWTRGDMPAVRGLCSRVNWMVSPYMPPNLVLYCAKDVGDPSAMGALGLYFMDTEGQRGFKQDWQQSFYWSTESANRGYSPGMGALSLLYYHGLGAAKNLAKAYQWCESAIRAGTTYPHCEKVRNEAVAQGITLPPTASTPTAPAVAPSSSVPANRDQSAPVPSATVVVPSARSNNYNDDLNEALFWEDSKNYPPNLKPEFSNFRLYQTIVAANARVAAKEAKTCALKMEETVPSRDNWKAFYSNAKQCAESWNKLKDQLLYRDDRNKPDRLFEYYFECQSVDRCPWGRGTSVYAKLNAQYAVFAAQDAERSAVEWRKKLKEGDWVFDKQEGSDGMVVEVKGNLVKVQFEWYTMKWGNQSKEVYRPKDQLYPPKK